MKKVILEKQILEFCQNKSELTSKKSICKILKHYFTQKEYLNLDFVHKTSIEFPELLVKYIKLYKAFFLDEHFKIFSEDFENHPNNEINNFYNEILFFKNFSDYISGYVSKFDFTLRKIAIDDLLIHMGLYYEKVRLENKSQEDFESKEVNIIDTFNNILNKKISFDNNISNINLTKVSFIKKTKEIINSKQFDKKINKMIIAYDQLQQFNYLINLYCLNNWEVDFETNKKIKLKPSDKKEYKNWLKNGYKYLYCRKWYNTRDHIYMPDETKKIIANFNINKNSRNVQFKTISNYIQYLDTHLPEIIEYNNNKFYMLTSFNLLNLLSENFSSRYLDIFKEPVVEKKIENLSYLDKISYIIDLGLKNGIVMGPLMYRREKDLIEGGLQTGADPKQIINIYNFLSNDLINFNNKSIDLSLRPFIKINDLYFSIPGILSNKNYSVMLQNNVMKSNLHDRNKQSDKIEEKLLKLFEENQFETKPNHIYKSLTHDNKIDGEIDLLAFKDKTLFIIELKTTYARSTVRECYNHEEKVLNEKAGNQLERASNYIKKRFTEIKDELRIDASYEEIIKYPLVVSTSFEGDYSLIKDKFRKISLFELKLILTNTKYWMFFEDIFDDEIKNLCANGLEVEAYRKIDRLRKKYHHKINKIQSQHNLWSKSNECSSQDLISAIEEDKVWEHLEINNYSFLTDKVITRDFEILYYY